MSYPRDLDEYTDAEVTAAGGVLGPRWTPGGLGDRMSRLVFAVDAFNRDAVRAYADEAETLACERVEALDMLSTIAELLGATGDADALVEHLQVALADYTIATEDARHLRADARATRAALGLAPEATTAEVVAAIGALRGALGASEAEVARLRAGGCARDQGLTQFCGEAVTAHRRGDEAHARGVAEERARCIAVARGCTDYSGGNHGETLEAFQHGIGTVVNALSAAPDSLQVRVLVAIGAAEVTDAPG
jgi:hypothetical protein